MSYETFQSQMIRQLLRYAVTQGQLGQLIFLWTLGIAAFVFFKSPWALGLVWTMVVLALGYGMTRSYMGSRQVRQQLLHATLEWQCLRQESWDASIWKSAPIRKGTDILVTAALDVDDMEKEHGPDADLRRAFVDAYGMLWLLYSLAKNAEELDRSLRLVDSGYPVDPSLPGEDTEVTVPGIPIQRNVEAVEELTTQAHSRADEVSEQLEAFLPALQVLKEQKAHFYQLAAAELAKETADVVGRMRARAG